MNESFRRSGNDTASGPEKVQYSNMKNLTEPNREDRAELYPTYQESFDMVFQKTGSYS